MDMESTFRFTWGGHSAGELETPGGKSIVFDPWFGNPRSPKSADAIERCDVSSFHTATSITSAMTRIAQPSARSRSPGVSSPTGCRSTR